VAGFCENRPLQVTESTKFPVIVEVFLERSWAVLVLRRIPSSFFMFRRNQKADVLMKDDNRINHLHNQFYRF